MKLLPLLAFLLLAPLPYGQENPVPEKVVQNVEKLVTGELGKISKGNADEPQKLVVGTERIHFFDGSDLKGAMLKLDQKKNLFWKHDSSSDPIRFKFRAIESMIIDRSLPAGQKESRKNLLRIQMNNGDQLRCNFKKLEKKALVVETGFANEISIPVQNVRKMEFLPPTHEILFDSTEGLGKWKSSNRKSWTAEEGDLVTNYSGSTGTILPAKDAIEVEFHATWERSFYLALRFFSDSDGASYGNTGYHLSFSNNRLNLQANKRTKGRVARETIGSVTVDEITKGKTARFAIFAHRKKKEFVVRINDREVARWKDPSEDFYPDGNGMLFINQGGSSYMRLKELNISGWNGKFFPQSGGRKREDATKQYAVFTNGDSTEVSSSNGQDDSFSLETKRGTFQVPRERLRSLHFAQQPEDTKAEPTSEQVFLNRSLGRLSFNLLSISEDELVGIHPSFGKFSIPLTVVKRMNCNQNLKKVREYLELLSQVKKALDERQPDSATTILNQTNPSFRGWYWGRLMLLAENMQSSEILSFAPHPEKGLTKASFVGSGNKVLTTGKDGVYSLWDGHAKLANAKFTESETFPIEIGRFSNEEQRVVTISRSFWLGESEVTQEQFEKIMGKNPSARKEPNLPVEVSWFDAQAFCKKLNETQKPPAGYEWRLPTEAEWEYACRAGSSGPFCMSATDRIPSTISDYAKHLDQFGWFAQNSSGETHPVKQKKANAFGLYDMHGNVWEWCLDAVKRNKVSFMQDRKTGIVDPLAKEGDWRALRGGNFEVPYSRCRSAYRGANLPSISQSDRGFRLALGPVHGEESNATDENRDKSRTIEDLSLTLKHIPKGSFLMGSPSGLTAPKAIARSLGNRLLTGSSKGALGSTDFSGRPIETLHKFNSSITALACLDLPTTSLSNPGNKPVTEVAFVGCQDGQTHLFDLKNKKLVKSFKDHKFPITTVAFDSKTSHFASSGLDGKINFYSSKDLARKWTFSGMKQNASVDDIEFSQDGSLILASGMGSTPIVINAKDGKIKMDLKNDLGNLVASHFHPDGKSVASVTESGLLIFTEVSSGIPYNLIRLKLTEVRDFSFSKFGDRVIVSNADGICSIRAFPRKGTIIVKSPDDSVEVTPDYFFALSQNNKAPISSLTDFLQKRGLNNEPGVTPAGCAYSPDKKWFVTSVDGALRLWRSETDSWVATIAEKLAAPIVKCAFSPQGDYIVAQLKTGHILAYPAMIGDNSATDLEKARPLEDWLEKSER
jgi:formylglycine-generating enzyme required for sulfatase activity/WD40 repeat protein